MKSTTPIQAPHQAPQAHPRHVLARTMTEIVPRDGQWYIDVTFGSSRRVLSSTTTHPRHFPHPPQSTLLPTLVILLRPH